MEDTKSIAGASAQGTVATTVEVDDSEQIPSFDEVWLEDLKAMGFDISPDGVEYRNASYAPPRQTKETEGEGEEESAPEPPPIQRMAVESVIRTAVHDVVSQYPTLGRVPYLTEAVQKWLASQPPESITPEVIKASVFTLYGMYKAKEDLFSEFKQDYAQKKNPLRSVPDNIWQTVNRWSELWGIPAEDILGDYLKEAQKK